MIQQWGFPVDEPVSLPKYARRLEESVELIAQRIRAGLSIRAVASEYGVSRESASRALARAGVVVERARQPQPDISLRRARAHRLPGRGRSRVFTPDDVAVLLARHDDGESIRSLARSTGVSHEAMRQTLARAACADAHSASA